MFGMLESLAAPVISNVRLLKMPPLTRRLDFALTWLIAIAAIVFGLAMVY